MWVIGFIVAAFTSSLRKYPVETGSLRTHVNIGSEKSPMRAARVSFSYTGLCVSMFYTKVEEIALWISSRGVSYIYCWSGRSWMHVKWETSCCCRRRCSFFIRLRAGHPHSGLDLIILASFSNSPLWKKCFCVHFPSFQIRSPFAP